MGNDIMGQYIAGDSVFHKMRGSTKLICFFLILTAVILTDSAAGFFLLFMTAAGSAILAGIGLRNIGKSIARLKLFFITIFLMNLFFFSSEQAWWSFWIFHLSPAGLEQGTVVVMRVVFLLLFSRILIGTTTPAELTGGLEILLSPLGVFGISTGETAMILSVAVQFIPILSKEADQIRKAQIARGAEFEGRHFWERAKSALPVVIPVFLAAFRRADELALAMEARGYRKEKAQRKRGRISIHLCDVQAIVLSGAVCMSQILL